MEVIKGDTRSLDYGRGSVGGGNGVSTRKSNPKPYKP